MSYNKRFDGRKMNQIRDSEAKVGVIKNAVGSAKFKIGNTIAYAAVYGPRDLYPKFLQNPTKAKLRCHYNMLPFSGMGDRIRPGQNRRAKEISMVTEKALDPVLDLTDFPNSAVDVFIELSQTDAGSRCAGICAASLALADAGFSMTDLVCAVAGGMVDGTPIVDPNYDEEAYEEGDVADIPLAMIPSTEEITLLQMDGRIEREKLKEVLELTKPALKEIYEIQKNALKGKFGDKDESN